MKEIGKYREQYPYAMQQDSFRTVKKVSGLKARCIDYVFWRNMQKRGDRFYWGWMCFDNEIPLYDAYEAGLVPLFKDDIGGE